jgi:hypothetical protein
MYITRLGFVIGRWSMLHIFRLTVALASTHVTRINPLEQHGELTRVDLHTSAAVSGPHTAERSLFQSLR